MNYTFTFIFSLLGFLCIGFSGLIIGAITGYILDRIIFSVRKLKTNYNFTQSPYYTDENQFVEEILYLIAYVAKSDYNRLSQSEFEYCKQYFRNTFPAIELSSLMLHFREILDSNNLDSQATISCETIKKYATTSEKLAIISCLLRFAISDGQAHQAELNAIRKISDRIGLPVSTYEALKQMYVGYSQSYSYDHDYSYSYEDNYSGKSSGNYSSSNRTFDNLDAYYKILEVSPDATDEEVKKAYRTAAMKYHPDKVGHLGEDVRQKAESTFAKVNEAYDKIKAARGMK